MRTSDRRVLGSNLFIIIMMMMMMMMMMMTLNAMENKAADNKNIYGRQAQCAA